MRQQLNAIADLYIAAIRTKSFSNLADFTHSDVTYTGPNKTAKGIQELASELKRIHGYFTDIDVIKSFVSEDEICLVSKAHSQDKRLSNFRFVDLIQVENGRMRNLLRVYDSQPVVQVSSEI